MKNHQEDRVVENDVAIAEAEQNLVIDAQFLIQEMLNEVGISQAELARRIGISKARVNQMLRSEGNPTLRTLARVIHALGDEVTLARKSKVTVPAPFPEWRSESLDMLARNDLDRKLIAVMLSSRSIGTRAVKACNENREPIIDNQIESIAA